MKTQILALGTTLAAALLATTASASTSDRVAVSSSVSYADLDLASTAGRDVLDRRLSTAVRRACGAIDTRDLTQIGDIRRCRREARAFAAQGRELAVAARTRRDAVALVTTGASDLGK